MSAVNPLSLTSSLSFRLGTLGTIATTRFTAAIEDHGLKPKHVALLAALDAGAASSQLELAQAMGVAPSLVVSMADQLEALGAVVRERDPADRRRQMLALTEDGRALLHECAAQAHAIDAELAAALSLAERESLRRALGVLAREAGLPVEE
ncbi:MarR family winged helix-turn-helix transcriptional regulator [Kitasatospora mediocidica]|uniref:MarR family winged helix-turn-helix transcriptional regulator n=1 Tax=Kitasatospora mediocidica TaxID=58352 RepID=UPI0005643097|nr:MarR family transcriptional regulator [Kitasatospora mediocidica]